MPEWDEVELDELFVVMVANKLLRWFNWHARQRVINWFQSFRSFIRSTWDCLRGLFHYIIIYARPSELRRHGKLQIEYPLVCIASTLPSEMSEKHEITSGKDIRSESNWIGRPTPAM